MTWHCCTPGPRLKMRTIAIFPGPPKRTLVPRLNCGQVHEVPGERVGQTAAAIRTQLRRSEFTLLQLRLIHL